MFSNTAPQNRNGHGQRTGPNFKRILIFCCLSMLVAACERPVADDADDTQYPAAPVTIYELVEQDFTREARLTGSVGLYREEEVGFEVGGRMLFVLDLGKEVEGPAYNEAGHLVRQGDVIAKVDDTRYRLRVQSLEARLQALRKDLEAQRIDVDRVAQADLKAARARLRISASDVIVAERQVAEMDAEVTRSLRDYNRQKDLKQRVSPAFREKTLDDAKAAYDAAAARKEQREALLDSRRRARDAQAAVVTVAEATIAFKQAKVESSLASIAELEQELRRAREDLGDTLLYAPFSGRVTEIHASQGAVVEAGKPIVTLTLMDPVQVRVAVSANTERRIRTGDRAWVFPKDPTDPERETTIINALVFEKGAVADPDTRTFRIDLIARNRRRLIHHVDPETEGLPVVTDFLPVARRFEGEPGPLFVPTDSIYREEGKTYVLRLPGISFHDDAQRNAIGKHMPQKIEVELGDNYFRVIKWNFRSLVASDDLREGDFLVIGPQKEHVDGLAIDRPQWLLRPGDLVPVRFLLNTTPKGFYVPINAITVIDRDHYLYLVVDGKAETVPVTVHETFGEFRRVAGDHLNVGSEVIVGGIHLVSKGQPVSIAGQLTNLSDGAPTQ